MISDLSLSLNVLFLISVKFHLKREYILKAGFSKKITKDLGRNTVSSLKVKFLFHNPSIFFGKKGISSIQALEKILLFNIIQYTKKSPMSHCVRSYFNLSWLAMYRATFMIKFCNSIMPYFKVPFNFSVSGREKSKKNSASFLLFSYAGHDFAFCIFHIHPAE